LLTEPLTATHALSAAEVARQVGGDPARGLREEEARARLARVGPNALERRPRPPYLAIALRQLADPLVALLLAAAAVSALIGEDVEAVAIGAIVLLNALLGFGQELGAERAILALRETVQRRASVVRDGREREIPVEELVPGDVVVLREGQRIGADGRIVRAEGLAVDESALTGESVPVEKSTRAVPAAAPLAERSSLVLGGTSVTRGRGTAIVTATGPRALIGEVTALAEAAKAPPTPLQRRLRGLTRLMVVVGVLITALLTGIRLLQGAPLEEAFLLGVSVAVAAVPEGLAATVTIALALGARRIAARGAITRRLPAVETLGSTTVVASDKTGTLTENRLRLRAAAPAGGRREEELLQAAVLASTAELIEQDGELRVAGDPVEGAFLLAAHERGISPAALRAERSLVREVPFDADRRRMTLVYLENGAARAFMKGAPEVVLARSRASGAERKALRDRAERWAADGLRVLAVAERRFDSGVPQDEEQIERDLDLLGLLALHDPLRKTAGEAVRRARAAGLRVQILTGDHPATAGAIARQLDLPESAVSARVTPADKLRLVETLQAEGEVVAVTGDGVNDAPALRRADVGVAMGRSGTEAAREASDVVLTDDDFSTIVAAIREGRAIADNVRKFVAFLLSANFGEVLLFAAAVLAGLGVPMTVVQVLTVNVLTDGLPAVALARDPAAPEVMQRSPERGDRLFGRESWVALGAVGLLVGAAAIGAFLAGRELEREASQTMAFATIALSELLVVFAVRSPLQPAWKEPANSYLFASVAASIVLLALTIYLAPLHEPFGTVALDATELAVVFAFALVPFAAIESAKGLLRRFAPVRAASALRPPR
jgi:Ca2+-transporting ATPase